MRPRSGLFLLPGTGLSGKPRRMILIHEGLVTSSKDVPNMPVGRTVFIQTDAALTIAWFDPNTGDFGATQAISTPGEEVSVPSYKVRIGTATTANIRIVLSP